MRISDWSSDVCSSDLAVVIGCRGEIIARHPRSWEREDVIFDPVHYLPLIEQKINSLDQAAPLQGWDLPEEFATLRRLMEGRMAKHGDRKSVVSGKSVSVRVDLGGRRIIKKKTAKHTHSFHSTTH